MDGTAMHGWTRVVIHGLDSYEQYGRSYSWTVSPYILSIKMGQPILDGCLRQGLRVKDSWDKRLRAVKGLQSAWFME
jgi:hypothetical protein